MRPQIGLLPAPGVDVEAEKRDQRRRVRSAIAALPPAQRALEEELVQAAIQAEPAWRGARRVLLYKAVPPEFSVVGLTLAAWREGKQTVFPRVAGPGALELHIVGSWGELQVGSFGIPEPSVKAPVVAPSDIDLAIAPGVAWDREGHRLGRGGGYYDRLTPHLKCPVWGVGFACQRVERLPRQSWDAKVVKTWISTPDGRID